MPEKNRTDLLGYVLGALSESELEEIAWQLGDDPQLARRCLKVRRRLARLGLDQVEYDPPPGLAARTCQAVSLAADMASAPAAGRQRLARATSSSALAAENTAAIVAHTDSQQRSWVPLRALFDVDTWLNAVVSAVVILLSALVVFSALGASREKARSLACEDQLHRVGIGLLQYGALQQAELFGPLRVRSDALAGLGPGRLLRAGLVDDQRWRQVAGAPLDWERCRCGAHSEEGILLVLEPAVTYGPSPATLARQTRPLAPSQVLGLELVTGSQVPIPLGVNGRGMSEPLAGDITQRIPAIPPALKALLPDGRIAPYRFAPVSANDDRRPAVWFTGGKRSSALGTPAVYQAGGIVPIIHNVQP